MSARQVVQPSKAKMAGIFVAGAFLGALASWLLYAFIVQPLNPLEPAVMIFLVLPSAVGIGFLCVSKAAARAQEVVEAQYMQPLQNETEEERAADIARTKVDVAQHGFNRTYKDFGSSMRFVFWLYALTAWVIRTCTIYLLASSLQSWALPGNVSDIPFSQWTLKILGGFVVTIIGSLATVLWWVSWTGPSDDHSFEENPYNNWFLASVWVAGIWYIFLGGKAVLENL